jgi:hypothetical protein
VVGSELELEFATVIFDTIAEFDAIDVEEL